MADKDNNDLLKQAEKRLGVCRTAENHNFNDARSDLKFLKGEHWPEDSKRQRTIEKRPCLTIKKHPAFLRQITNDQRQNRPSIHVHPVDDAADPKLAEVLEGMIRHIEYASNADVCYDTSVHSAAAVGFGYFRLTPITSPRIPSIRSSGSTGFAMSSKSTLTLPPRIPTAAICNIVSLRPQYLGGNSSAITQRQNP